MRLLRTLRTKYISAKARYKRGTTAARLRHNKFSCKQNPGTDHPWSFYVYGRKNFTGEKNESIGKSSTFHPYKPTERLSSYLPIAKRAVVLLRQKI